jgi:hypothetical protein
MLVRVEMPAGSPYKHFTVSLPVPVMVKDVLVALSQKRVLVAEARECFLYDLNRKENLAESERVVPGQLLRLVYSSSEDVSDSMIDEIFETDAIDIGSMYVGSVQTGMKAPSPLKRVDAKTQIKKL